MKHDDDYFLDKPGNVRKILHALFVICALLFALDLFIHRHTLHSWENLWGFYAIYGFVGCVILVVIAKWMRGFLMRSEEYYDREELKDVEGGRNVDT